MITVVINGQSFDYPEVGDTDWGNAATVAFQSLAATTLQKDAGAFTLENELDFGGNYGVKVLFISSCFCKVIVRKYDKKFLQTSRIPTFCKNIPVVLWFF